MNWYRSLTFARFGALGKVDRGWPRAAMPKVVLTALHLLLAVVFNPSGRRGEPLSLQPALKGGGVTARAVGRLFPKGYPRPTFANVRAGVAAYAAERPFLVV
jgi:hypothetical protein